MLLHGFAGFAWVCLPEQERMCRHRGLVLTILTDGYCTGTRHRCMHYLMLDKAVESWQIEFTIVYVRRLYGCNEMRPLQLVCCDLLDCSGLGPECWRLPGPVLPAGCVQDGGVMAAACKLRRAGGA